MSVDPQAVEAVPHFTHPALPDTQACPITVLQVVSAPVPSHDSDGIGRVIQPVYPATHVILALVAHLGPLVHVV